jgi:hypothetical protein
MAFGVKIKCELDSAVHFGLAKISETEDPDVVIRYGSVPKSLENGIYTDRYISASNRSILLDISGVARYLIRDGEEIMIEPYAGANDGDIATYAFGTAAGTMLYQRGILALHGSAVGTQNGAVIFTGEKGAGKSTTATALSSRNHCFLSDDVCAVTLDAAGKPLLHPGLTRSKLAYDSYLAIIGREPTAPPVSPVMNKYAASFSGSREAWPLLAICALEESTELSIEEMKGRERLMTVIRNIYRPLIYALTELPEDRFFQCASLAASVACYRIRRPKCFDHFEEFLCMIESDIFGQ